MEFIFVCEQGVRVHIWGLFHGYRGSVICKRHDEVTRDMEDMSRNIRSTLRRYSEDTDSLVELLDDIDSSLCDWIHKIEEAKESGQKMEDRLKEYRDAIEGLGFNRDAK